MDTAEKVFIAGFGAIRRTLQEAGTAFAGLSDE
jgi:hypothetical protein